MSAADDNILKLLVFGDVEGNFQALSKRLTALNAKAGSFECAFCVGNFFGDQIEQKSSISDLKTPIPVYVLGANTTDSTKYFSGENPELAENVTYLGSKGVFHMATGVSVAYLSGIEGTSAGPCQFDSKTVTDLIKLANAGSSTGKRVDVFLTSQWPNDVWKYDAGKPAFSTTDLSTSDQIARAASALRPRYHFSGLNDVFYARQPYRNHKVLSESANQVTRFVGLAKFASNLVDKAKKATYAFNITPMSKLDRAKLTEQPPDTSEFPYAAVLNEIRRESQQKQEDNQYFFNMTDSYEDEESPRKRRKKGGGRYFDQKSQQSSEPRAPCWFCLSNSEVEKHLVIAIGSFAYLALAKGGLTPDHALILPIDHVQSISAASDELLSEVGRFKEALRTCFDERCKKNVVFFERNFKTQHFQIQAVPVSKNLDPEKIAETFAELAEHYNIKLSPLPEDTTVSAVVTEGNPYFWVETAPSSTQFCLISDRKFPVQFGREVLASPRLLNVPEKADWKDCKVSRDQEFEYANRLRERFKKFDFTDDDDDSE